MRRPAATAPKIDPHFFILADRLITVIGQSVDSAYDEWIAGRVLWLDG